MIQEGVNKFKVAMFKKGLPNTPTKVQKVGRTWEAFGAIEGDLAKKVDTGVKGSYCMLYKSNKGYFKKHFHENKEAGIVLKGRIKINTPFESYIVEESCAFEIPPFMWHDAQILEDDTEIFIQYHPPFENDEWVGNFEPKKAS